MNGPDGEARNPVSGIIDRINGGVGGTISLDDAAALQARFSEVFPAAVRAAVLDERPEDIFCNWSGIMYGDQGGIQRVGAWLLRGFESAAGGRQGHVRGFEWGRRAVWVVLLSC